jgi:hypothetical protein
MTEENDLLNLVKTYFNVCNAALARSRDRPLHGMLESVFASLVAPARLEVNVIDEEHRTLAVFHSEFIDDQFKPVREGPGPGPDASLQVSERLLIEVAEQSAYFIEHPEKLDWSWARQRLV